MLSKPSEPSKTLYVANFPKETQKQELEKVLGQDGKLIKVSIVYKEKFAFAFADYETVEDATKVQENLDQKNIWGMNIKVNFKEKRERDNDYGPSRGSDYPSPPYYDKGKNGNDKDVTYKRRYSVERKKSLSSSSDYRKRSPSRQKQRSRNKEYRRGISEEESVERHRKRSRDIRSRDISKKDERDRSSDKNRYPRDDTRRDRTISLEKDVQKLTDQVEFFRKRLLRLEDRFEEFLSQYKNKDYKRR